MKKAGKYKITKYPRVLAETETKSRRSYPSDIRVTPETDRAFLANPAAFSLQNVYPYIFDGLTAICSDFVNTEFTYFGETMQVIRGQNDKITHYEATVPIKVFKELCLGGHIEYWDYVKKELHLMHKNPASRLLPFAPGYLIKTHPLEVDFVYEDGAKESDIKRLENIGADKKIKWLILRFYKPLFSSILQRNNKGSFGNNYLQIPRAFQANLAAALSDLEFRYKHLSVLYPTGDDRVALFMRAIAEKLNNEMPQGWTYTPMLDYASMLESIISLSAVEARNIFLFIACHDNRQKDYIDINSFYADFVIGCFPGLVEIRKKGNVYIKPENKKLIEKKLKGFTYLCNYLSEQGSMNGAQFLPIVFDYQNNLIKVQRKKNLCYNNQPELPLY